MKMMALSPALGVEVLDFDVAASGRAEDIDALREAFDRHHLLLFRDQQLTDEQHLQFVARFGPLAAEHRPWSFVSNVRADGIVAEGGLLFHSDFAFAREAMLGLSLHALEVPSDGAPTVFASATRAVELLPPALRSRLEATRVLNIYDFRWPGDRKVREHQLAPGSPRTLHPTIGRHPITGVEVVMANEMHSDRIVDAGDGPGGEPEDLLAALLAAVYQPGNCYEHVWRVGDLLLWDNIALHHGRATIPLDEARTLRRVALGRYLAHELVPHLDQLLGRPAIG